MKQLIRKKRFWVILLFSVILTSFNSCFSFRKSNKQIYKSFLEYGLIPVINYYKVEEKSIRYIASQNYDANKPTLIFLHGSPGSSQDFYTYLQDSSLYNRANLIVMDRLGYGYSDFGNAETSIAKQAFVINSFLNRIETKQILIVGWSFGGPIAAKMAIQNSEIDALLLLAPAIDPKHEKHFTLGYLAKWKATRWFVPKTFRVAESEKLAHITELENMKDDWGKLQIPVFHMHGNKDKLVPFENLAFSEKIISKDYLTSIIVEDGGHLLPWKNYELVQNKILELLVVVDK